MESDVVRRAYLKVTGSKGLIGSLVRIGAKKNWVVLRRESHSSRSRVEVFKDEDDFSRRQPIKIVGIEQISSVNTSPEKKEIILNVGSENVILTCSSRADVDDWMRDIEALRQNGRGLGKRKSGDDGIPYPDDEFFRVKLRQSSSLLFHGPCILEIQRDFERNLFHLALFSEEDSRRSIVKWQIDHIRQYGSNDVAFKFQSGSKSPTGVDWFILDTEHGNAPRIHRAVDYWARHIVEQANNMPPPLPIPVPPRVAPGMRSRAKTNSSSSPVPSPQSLSSTYTPLLSTGQPPSIYEDLHDRTQDNGRFAPLPPPTPPSSSIPTSPNSVYQPLIRHSINGSEPNANSTYADLNDVTRDRSVSMTTKVSGENSDYMGLNMATRNTQDSVYMGVNHNP